MKKALLLFTLPALLLLGCSKERVTERKLKRVGEWNITSLSWTKVTQEVVTTDQDEIDALNMGTAAGSRNDAGTFTFKKNGSGNFDYELETGLERSGNMFWDTDDNGVTTVTDISMSIWQLIVSAIQDPNMSSDFSYEQELFAYTLTKDGKNKYLLEGGGSIQVVSISNNTDVGQYVYVLEGVLEKP